MLPSPVLPMPTDDQLREAASLGMTWLKYSDWVAAGRPREGSRLTMARVRAERNGFKGEDNPNWKGGLVTCVCERCGVTYQKKPAAGRGRFCTLVCFNAWQKEQRVGEGIPKKERVIARCRQCGAENAVIPSRNTVNHRSYCSPVCSARWRLEHTTKHGAKWSYGKGGAREDLGGTYFRSCWEANFARILNWRVAQGDLAKWEYEVDTFWFKGITRGSRTYTPDFKLTLLDGSFYYVEIKGHMDQRSATKMKRMSKYFPDVRVDLVQKEDYRHLTEMFAGFLPEWESS